jgi:hypothetical protein
MTGAPCLTEVNDSPVVLPYGSTPAYPSPSAGATGADVAELNAYLVALGYATSAQLSPTSDAFRSATTTALEKLHAALGEAQTAYSLWARQYSNRPPRG